MDGYKILYVCMVYRRISVIHICHRDVELVTFASIQLSRDINRF